MKFDIYRKLADVTVLFALYDFVTSKTWVELVGIVTHSDLTRLGLLAAACIAAASAADLVLGIRKTALKIMAARQTLARSRHTNTTRTRCDRR